MSIFVKKSAFGIEGSGSNVKLEKESNYANHYSALRTQSQAFRAMPRHHPAEQKTMFKEKAKERAVHPMIINYDKTSPTKDLVNSDAMTQLLLDKVSRKPFKFEQAENKKSNLMSAK